LLISSWIKKAFLVKMRFKRSSKLSWRCCEKSKRIFLLAVMYGRYLGESILDLSGNSNLVDGQRIFRKIHWFHILSRYLLSDEFDYSMVYFTCRVCKQLENMNGMELFNLSWRWLKQLCGLSERSRLNGQLTLAKNECVVSAS